MIHEQRRKLLTITAAGLCSLALPSRAQSYPDKPIRLVVPYVPGGATDVGARLLAQRMGDVLRQPIIVENRPGGGGNVGTASVARSAADGYTLVIGTGNTLAANVSVFSRMPFDPLKDLAPVGMYYFAPSMVCVNLKMPAQNMAEFISLLKKSPTGYPYGTGGVGSSSQFAGELLNLMLDVKMTHIPYKGDTPGLTDLIGGSIPVVICNMPSGMKFYKSGDIRVLAITSEKRSPAFPEIPTIADSGLKDFDISAWFNVMAPAGTPPAIINTLNSAMAVAMGDSQLREAISRDGGILAPMKPAEVTTLIKNETAKFAKIAKAADIRAD